MNSTILTSLQRFLCNPFHYKPSSIKPISYLPLKMKNLTYPEIISYNKHITHVIRNGSLNNARKVFDEMPQRNTRTWNTMINGYVKNMEIHNARKLFDEMPETDKDVVTWNLMVYGYFSCNVGGFMRYLDEGRMLFDRMPKRDLVTWNTVISGYARVGRMNEALNLFSSMPVRDVVSWNGIIMGFLRNGDIDRAIDWFRNMPRLDESSLSALVSGLVRNDELDKAMEVLVECRKRVGNKNGGCLVRGYNTLIVGYGHKGRVDVARRLFDQMPYHPLRRSGDKMGGFERNVVTWNAIIMSYVKVGDIVSARELFDQMMERDSFSWNTMIRGYVQVLDMDQAVKLFSQMPNPDTLSWNMMVSGYAQTGNLDLSLYFFNKNPCKTLVSWNSMIAGCDRNGDYERSIKLFMQMQVEEVKPDRHTLSSILSVCTRIVALDLGKQIHQQITKTVTPDIPMNNSLISMYSRCGAIVEARAIFDEMGRRKDVITWNAIIGGYASHGHATKALELFEAMKRKRVNPTYITFISVLNACAHAGLPNEGREYFASMVSDFGIEPKTEHYAAIVDIACRYGQLEEAFTLINNMPCKPEKAVWGALLGACRVHNNVKLARIAAEELLKLEPDSSAPYILLHNMLVDVEQWEDARQVRESMKANNVWKECASSFV